MLICRFSRITAPGRLRPLTVGRLAGSAYSCALICSAPRPTPMDTLNSSPSAIRNETPPAPNSRAVVSAIVRSVGSASPGDAAMARRMSEVAVCRSSDPFQIAVARIDLVEEPRVFDGDHRLVGEGAQQLDLTFGEQLDVLRLSPRCRSPFLRAEWHAQGRYQFCDGHRFRERIVRDRSARSDNVHHLAFKRGPPAMLPRPGTIGCFAATL